MRPGSRPSTAPGRGRPIGVLSRPGATAEKTHLNELGFGQPCHDPGRSLKRFGAFVIDTVVGENVAKSVIRGGSLGLRRGPAPITTPARSSFRAKSARHA
jgi:hypothetical protein